MAFKDTHEVQLQSKGVDEHEKNNKCISKYDLQLLKMSTASHIMRYGAERKYAWNWS